MAVTCPQCGEFAYAEGVCEHCGGSLATVAPPAWAQDAAAWPDPALDLALVGTSGAPVSAEGIGRATANVPAPQRRLRIRKLPQDLSAPHDDQEWDFSVDGKQISIGRAPSCDLTLESDLLVSRRHAILFSRDGTHLVLDLGSSNGTWVNDTVITDETPLRVGDAIRIGEYELVYDTPSAIPEAPTAPLPEDATPAPAPHEEAPWHTVSAAAAWGAGDVPATDEQALAFSPDESQGDSSELAESSALDPAVHRFAGSPAAQTFQARALSSPAPADHNLESLESQVVGLVTALRQQAEEDARYAGDLRQVLREAQTTVADLVSRYGTLPTEGLALDELVAVVHQAAENPRHLDYLTSLAANAGALAQVVDTFSALYAPQGLLDTLATLKQRLDQTLG